MVGRSSGSEADWRRSEEFADGQEEIVGFATETRIDGGNDSDPARQIR
jgi:hypothetical protein